MKSQDSSDTGKDWLLAIQGLTTDEEKIKEYWNEIISKERTLSYHKVEYLLIGFNSSLSTQFKKHKYMIEFFDKLP